MIRLPLGQYFGMRRVVVRVWQVSPLGADFEPAGAHILAQKRRPPDPRFHPTVSHARIAARFKPPTMTRLRPRQARRSQVQRQVDPFIFGSMRQVRLWKDSAYRMSEEEPLPRRSSTLGIAAAVIEKESIAL